MSAECVFSSDTDSLCLLSFFFCFVSLVIGFLPHCSFQRTSTLLHWFSLLFLCSHFIDFCFYLYYTWPLNNVEATGAYPSPSQKSTYNFTVGPSHQGSASTDSTNHRTVDRKTQKRRTVFVCKSWSADSSKICDDTEWGKPWAGTCFSKIGIRDWEDYSIYLCFQKASYSTVNIFINVYFVSFLFKNLKSVQNTTFRITSYLKENFCP